MIFQFVFNFISFLFFNKGKVPKESVKEANVEPTASSSKQSQAEDHRYGLFIECHDDDSQSLDGNNPKGNFLVYFILLDNMHFEFV